MRRTLAIAAIGLSGLLGVAACSTAHAPPPSAAQTNNNSTAREIANIAVGKGGLTALHDDNGQASSAYCDPSTVSRPSIISTSMSVSCRVKYSDRSVWDQTVTVAFNDHGSPLAVWAYLGTEVWRPSTDAGPVRCNGLCPR